MTQTSRTNGTAQVYAYTQQEGQWGFKAEWSLWINNGWVKGGKVRGYFPTEIEAQEAAFKAAF